MYCHFIITIDVMFEYKLECTRFLIVNYHRPSVIREFNLIYILEYCNVH